jgi:WD40 repeat protein
MFLVTASRTNKQVCLWDVTGSPTAVATQEMSTPLAEFDGHIHLLTFSRDGLYLAVTTDTEVEIWNFPELSLVSRIQHDKKNVVVLRRSI